MVFAELPGKIDPKRRQLKNGAFMQTLSIESKKANNPKTIEQVIA